MACKYGAGDQTADLARPDDPMCQSPSRTQGQHILDGNLEMSATHLRRIAQKTLRSSRVSNLTKKEVRSSYEEVQL